MKGFYAILGGIAVVGVGALLWARSGASRLPSEPLSAAAVQAAMGFEGYVVGSDTAPIQVIEYADFQCPACSQFWVLTMPQIYERLIGTGKVRWTFRDMPLDAHDKAQLAHHAAACASEQGLFWPMHDKLYAEQRVWYGLERAEGPFRDYAREIGADPAAYDECMGEGRYRARIQASFENAISTGVSSTPSFVIGDRIYPGALPFDDFNSIIDSLLEVGTQ
jgi:protein-disulfide isomerase